MKRKNAFTLIELLAVIVVLAIIALIATPIVMNTIKNAKKGAAERTTDNYIKQVETAVAEARINGTKITNGTYNIQPDGNLCPVSGCGKNDKDKITIDMSGNKPTSGKIKITNGSVDQTSSSMTIGDYTVSYNSTKKTYEATEKGSSSTDDGTSILCKAVTTATTGNVPSGSFNYGDEYICTLGNTDDSKNLTFFVLDKTDTEVSLIMNKNLGGTVSWCKRGSSNSCAADGIKESLIEKTTNWNKITDKTKITISTYEQIYKAAGNTEKDLPKWLYDYLYSPYDGDPYGYWTSTPSDSDSSCAYFVTYGASLYSSSFAEVDDSGTNGVRPVITILKSQLS